MTSYDTFISPGHKTAVVPPIELGPCMNQAVHKKIQYGYTHLLLMLVRDILSDCILQLDHLTFRKGVVLLKFLA